MSNINKGIGFSGLVYASSDTGSGVYSAVRAANNERASVDDEFGMLMSLALDDRLAENEVLLFDEILLDKPDFAEIWNDWQAIDSDFHTAPAIEPPVNFVTSFEERLLRQVRRNRLWWGAGIGLTALFLLGVLVTGLASAGAYVVFNQADWLTSAVRLVVYWSATIQSQLSAYTSMLTAALSTPQAQGMVIVYLAFGMLALWGWAKLLRRTVVQKSTVSTAITQ